MKAIEFMIDKERCGIHEQDTPKRADCGTFVFGKQTNTPFKGGSIKNLKELMIHMDMCGPLEERTYGGNTISSP